MKVKDLIKRLESFDSEMEVVMSVDEEEITKDVKIELSMTDKSFKLPCVGKEDVEDDPDCFKRYKQEVVFIYSLSQD